MKRNKKDIVINNSYSNSINVNKIINILSYIVFGNDKRVAGISALFGDLTGLTEASVIGKAVTGCIPVEKNSQKRFSEFIDTVISDKKECTGEFVIETPDGFRSKQVMIAFPMDGGSGDEGLYILLCFHESINFTHLISTDEKKDVFTALIDQIPIGVCIHIDRKFVFVNKAGLKLFHAKNIADMMGRSIFDFVHPDFRHPVVKRVEFIDSHQGEVPFIEEKFLSVNQEVIDVEAFGSSINYLGKQAVIVFCRNIGVQKSIEKRLTESEQKYQSLFDSMMSGFAYHKMVYDEQGNPADYEFIEANPSYLKMMGLTGKNIIGKLGRDIFPDVDESIVRRFGTLADTGETLRFEQYRADRDQYFEISAYSPVKGYFAAVYRDITVRKNFELTLKNERDLFNQIVDISPVGLLVLDKHRKVVFINKSVQSMAGIDDGEQDDVMNRSPILRFSYPDGTTVPENELPNMIVMQTKSFIRNKTYQVEFINGIKKYVSVNGAPVMDSLGGVDRVVLSIQDISDSYRIEIALEQLIRVSALTGQEFFNAMVLGFAKIFELDYVMICVLDDSPEHKAHTIAVCKHDSLMENMEYGLSNTPCDSISGNKFCVYQSGVRALFPKAQLLNDLKIEGYGGMPLNSSKGRQLGILSVMSEKPLSDVQLIEKFASLFAARISSEIERLQMEEERVKIEEQLRHSQKMETIGRLVGGIAHDFNNMLTPIIGYADMILKFDLDPGTSAYESMEELYEAATRAKNLTRQLLAFGRKQMLLLKTVNLNDIITDFYKILRRTIREDIRMEFEPDPGLWLIEADTTQIEQIVLNLCINAQDAMPEGGDLIIRTRNEIISAPKSIENELMSPGNYSVIIISDSGTGIDSENMKHIFEPFFTTKRELGTGLGLATAYGIVRQHQGYIAVHSREGKGTEFEIYFPKAVKPADEGDEPDRLGDSIPDSKAGETTVLLVEDDASVRTLTETILRKFGYHVISAADAGSAKTMIQNSERKIDLLLTDVVMPEINGQELYHFFKQTYPDLKVLFMSGYTGNLLDLQGFKFSTEEYIQKPFSLNQLIEKIRGII